MNNDPKLPINMSDQKQVFKSLNQRAISIQINSPVNPISIYNNLNIYVYFFFRQCIPM